MKTLIRLGLMMAFCQTGSVVTAAIVYNTVGVYDADTVTFTNTVDYSAAASTTGNQVTLASFKSLVSTAYAGGYGGVIDFESPISGNTVAPQLSTPNDYLQAKYGTGFASTLNIQNTSHSTYIFGTAVDRTAVSGSGYLAKSGTLVTDGTIPAQNFWFGFSAADKVVAVGATVISRLNNSGTTRGRVLFSDGSNIFVDIGIAGTNADDDTFFGFQTTAAQKSAGVYITGLQFDQTVYRGIDDLAFVVVPEPGKASLLMLGLVGWMMRRRRF